MSKVLEVVFACDPGKATPELAADCERRVLDLLNTIADDLAPGQVRFERTALSWVDDGKDEIRVRVSA